MLPVEGVPVAGLSLALFVMDSMNIEPNEVLTYTVLYYHVFLYNIPYPFADLSGNQWIVHGI